MKRTFCRCLKEQGGCHFVFVAIVCNFVAENRIMLRSHYALLRKTRFRCVHTIIVAKKRTGRRTEVPIRELRTIQARKRKKGGSNKRTKNHSSTKKEEEWFQ
ncbi:hypothetical protein [Bacillus sp. B1-b2]|uniref:hypothetical protein n=1 Tax=Bacillus sp. B1-b2 TaxID=2653201 RepID=UPI001261BD7B|nr:hypothetical protein [Bacillus sp. B1-b2]